MPAVFVHGVPDTQQMWDAVIARLDRKDVVTLSLPGFGGPLPQGFSATKEGYVAWLLAELAALSGPIASSTSCSTRAGTKDARAARSGWTTSMTSSCT